MTNLFTDADVVSTYTDAEAVDDGVLVDVGEGNRVTTNLWEWLVEHAPETPPERWPVDLMRFVAGDRPLAMARGLILAHGDAARRTHEQNIGGGIWVAHAITSGEATTPRIVGLTINLTAEQDEYEGSCHVRALWLIPNEVGGLTLMFPEDY